MRIAVLIARLLLGLIFLVFGLNMYLHFIPAQPIPGDAGAFYMLLVKHHWFDAIGFLYIVAGILLLIGRYVPIALVLLGPILVNILMFHITMDPAGIPPGLVCSVLEVFLIWAYWPAFQGIFDPAISPKGRA